jgi:protein-S-isoprenylcysteine O-methyltransferase Ste14
VEAGQRVIANGPYSIVRHPMDAGSVVLWISMPFALGSYVAFPAFV